MLVVVLLALAYGTPNFSFPWWVWALAVFVEPGIAVGKIKFKEDR